MVILLVLGVVLGVSYAWWSTTAVQKEINKITSDCLELKIINDKNEINLTSAYPIRDSETKNLIPYEFTIENTCNLDVEYNVYLEILKNELASQYIDVSLNNGTKKILGNLEENKEPLLKETVEARMLAKKKRLKAKESITYTIKLWIDESVTLEDNVQNKSFEGKVVVNGSIAGPENTMVAYNNSVDFWQYRANITKVIFEDKMNPKETELSWDVSTAQDGRVMSYLVTNEKAEETEEDIYTLYIQGDGGVIANSNCNNLFSGFSKLESIEGLEYFDTSNVTSMYQMFNGCANLINLDLSSFNTSNVKSMQQMFNSCSKLISLDLSSFDTSKVINMGAMFFSCSNLVELDLSSFDTSNVIKYEAVYGMFGYCSKLKNINYGENFIYKEGASIGAMFYNCPANKPTHSSWNGVL